LAAANDIDLEGFGSNLFVIFPTSPPQKKNYMLNNMWWIHVPFFVVPRFMYLTAVLFVLGGLFCANFESLGLVLFFMLI
jgi:hypothetical protein